MESQFYTRYKSMSDDELRHEEKRINAYFFLIKSGFQIPREATADLEKKVIDRILIERGLALSNEHEYNPAKIRAEVKAKTQEKVNKQNLTFLYIGVAIVFLFMVFFGINSSRKSKPKIYVDNFSGSDVEIAIKDNEWLRIPKGTTQIQTDLKPGKYRLLAKRIDNNVVDTINISLKERGKYVLNLFQGMRYIEGIAKYNSGFAYPGDNTPDIPKMRNEKFFSLDRHDFIFQKPSKTIESDHIRGFTRKYIKREHENWAE